MSKGPTSFGDRTNRHLTQVEVRLTGKKYCTTCNATKPIEGGEMVRYRWMCGGCVHRRNTRQRSA